MSAHHKALWALKVGSILASYVMDYANILLWEEASTTTTGPAGPGKRREQVRHAQRWASPIYPGLMLSHRVPDADLFVCCDKDPSRAYSELHKDLGVRGNPTSGVGSAFNARERSTSGRSGHFKKHLDILRYSFLTRIWTISNDWRSDLTTK